MAKKQGRVPGTRGTPPVVDLYEMAIKEPDPRLRQRCKEIAAFDRNTWLLGRRLKDLVKADPRAVGLSAPQIGVMFRLVAHRTTEGVGVLVNPEIVERSVEVEDGPEGCFSLPGVMFLKVERACWIRVRACDIQGRPVGLRLDGFAARIIQHELDHLDGVLVCDHGESVPQEEWERMVEAGESTLVGAGEAGATTPDVVKPCDYDDPRASLDPPSGLCDCGCGRVR